MVAQAYEDGRAGALMNASEAVGLLGVVAAVSARLAALAGRRSRAAAVVGGAALVAASACTRFGIFEAGRASAADPKYTVVPQRERLAKQAAEKGAE